MSNDNGWIGGSLGPARDELDYVVNELNLPNRMEGLRQIMPHLADQIRAIRKTNDGRLDVGQIVLRVR